MTSLTYVKRTVPSADLGPDSSLPPLGWLTAKDWISGSVLDDDDGLWVSYGLVPSPFPYRDQDNYTRSLKDTEYGFFVLENDYLRASFLPDYGGKLWSLFDKKSGRDLLFDNPVVRPCNLAIRNAWTSGGVEWNCGFLGHHPHTCSRIYSCVTTLGDCIKGARGLTYRADTPVLRMYEYERVRGVVYQMDFFLPDGSPVLLCRMRIYNPNATVVPMYWWSNMAVPEYKKGRVITPADQTYTTGQGGVIKIGVPFNDMLDFDITYPGNLNHSRDYFFKLDDSIRRYETYVGEDGFGLIQASTKRLQGRKLFTWGQGAGGDRWQEYLSGCGNPGRYVEIQAGLCRSQYESMPMPPKTAWEWLETYGAMNADPEKAHGDWHEARAEVESKLAAQSTEEELESILRDTKKMALTPAGELVTTGSGWGALENLRREKSGEAKVCPHLDFGGIGGEQEQWRELLESGRFGAKAPLEVPASYISGESWTAAAEKAAHVTEELSWYSHYQYGVMLTAARRFAEAKAELSRSFELEKNPWAVYALSQIARLEGQGERSASLLLSAAAMVPGDVSMAKAALKALTDSGMYSAIPGFCAALTPETAAIPRVRLYLAGAYVKLGELKKAEDLLYEDGGMVVADIREGEISITSLWYEIEEKKAAAEGREFDRKAVKPPVIFDFRMS